MSQILGGIEKDPAHSAPSVCGQQISRDYHSRLEQQSKCQLNLQTVSEPPALDAQAESQWHVNLTEGNLIIGGACNSPDHTEFRGPVYS